MFEPGPGAVYWVGPMTTDAGQRATSFPKDRIKVLLLENIHTSAQQLFAAEHFQVEALKHALKEIA